MNVQELRKALLMASDAAEVRIAFREIMPNGDEYEIDAPVGGTLFKVHENEFHINEAEAPCSDPLGPESASNESPSPGQSPA